MRQPRDLPPVTQSRKRDTVRTAPRLRLQFSAPRLWFPDW